MLQRLFALIALLLVATLAGLLIYSQQRPEEPRVSGFLEAHEIRLGSRVGGRVARVRGEEGDHVRAGDVLVELEPFDLVEKKRQAEAELAHAEAELARLENGFRPEEKQQAEARHEQAQAQLELLEHSPRAEELQAARSRLEIAQAEQKLAESTYERNRGLFAQGAITEQEWERINEVLQAARGMVIVRQKEIELLQPRPEELALARQRVAEAQAAWDLARNGYRTEDIAASRAARDAARAAVEAWEARQRELAVTAPVDGIIESLEVRAGDLVQSDAPLLSLIDEHELWVRAYVPQRFLRFDLGQMLPVVVDAFPERKLQGEVIYIARQAEFTPGNVQTPEERSKQVYRIKVRLREPSPDLHPGMSADVWLEPIEGGP